MTFKSKWKAQLATTIDKEFYVDLWKTTCIYVVYMLSTIYYFYNCLLYIR